jgi:hypothetical protein
VNEYMFNNSVEGVVKLLAEIGEHGISIEMALAWNLGVGYAFMAYLKNYSKKNEESE